MMSLEEKRTIFIQQAKEKFKDRFDYSKVDLFINKETDKICIICPIHGEFFVTPKSFLKSKNGCPKCAKNRHIISNVNLLSEKDGNNILELHSIESPIICDKEHYIGTVYCFINTINNKLYIGETVRSNYTERFNEHRQKAELLNYPGCTYFYKAIRKYGWNNFSKIILFQTEVMEATPENKSLLNDLANEKEIYYINKYKTTNHKFGYNITSGGDGVVGYKFSEESRIKMSEARKGEKHWNFGNLNNSTSKTILQFDKNFKFVKEWPSMHEIERDLGICSNNISSCCNNVITSYKGYIWVKKEDYYEGYLQKYKKRANCKSNDKIVLQYDFLGNFIKSYISCAEAGRALGRKSVSTAASGRDPQLYGYIWIYKEDFSEELLNQKLNAVKKCKYYDKIIKSLVNDNKS